MRVATSTAADARRLLPKNRSTRAAWFVTLLMSVALLLLPWIVRLDGKPVDLTSVEFNLLEVLLREAGRVVPRERLVNAVLSRKFLPFDRSIDMHVSKVRKKLGDTDNDEHIKTVRGVGYIFARPREKSKV